MQLFGAGYDPLLFHKQNASLYEQAQKLRAGEADVLAQAQRLRSEANANGQSATTQVNYGRGPDGKSYVKSVTVTRSESVSITESSGEPDALGGLAFPTSMADISPVRMPLSPSDMAEGFAARMRETAEELAESLTTRDLQHADAGVRNHEGLHFRVAGGLASGLPVLEYMQGPDGQYYAVAGAVHVNTGSTTDEQKAARDSATFARAATAPGDVSAQDMLAARNAHASAAERYGKALSARSLPQSEINMVA